MKYRLIPILIDLFIDLVLKIVPVGNFLWTAVSEDFQPRFLNEIFLTSIQILYSDHDDSTSYRLFLFGWDDYFNPWPVIGTCYTDVNK